MERLGLQECPALPPPSPCSSAPSITNAKLGAWVGRSLEALAKTGNVPGASAWAGWIAAPHRTPTWEAGGTTSRSCSPGSLRPVLGEQPWGASYLLPCTPRRTRPNTVHGESFLLSSPTPQSPPPPAEKGPVGDPRLHLELPQEGFPRGSFGFPAILTTLLKVTLPGLAPPSPPQPSWCHRETRLRFWGCCMLCAIRCCPMG